jgi:hypothetical protein
MDIFIIVLALGVATAIGAGVGFYVASQWQFILKVARKEDYEAKLNELEKIIENMVANAEPEGVNYSAYDMFPPNLDPEYGLPRSIKE